MHLPLERGVQIVEVMAWTGCMSIQEKHVFAGAFGSLALVWKNLIEVYAGSPQDAEDARIDIYTVEIAEPQSTPILLNAGISAIDNPWWVCKYI